MKKLFKSEIHFVRVSPAFDSNDHVIGIPNITNPLLLFDKGKHSCIEFVHEPFDPKYGLIVPGCIFYCRSNGAFFLIGGFRSSQKP